MHPSQRELSALILAALFLLLGKPGIVRGQSDPIPRDNRLEARAGQNLTSIGQMYSTSRAQPAMLALNGGTILSINDHVSVLPPRGIIGLEAKGIGSRITAENLNITALVPGRTGTVGAISLDGGLIGIDGGSIRILGDGGSGLFANNGTVSASNLAILMEGIDSHGAQAQGTGLIILGPGTTITTIGAGGIGILASNGGRVDAHGVAITTSGIFSALSGFHADGATALSGSITLENSSITTNGDGADGLHATDANSSIFGTNLSITTNGVLGSGAEADQGGSIELNGATITANGLDTYGLTVSGTGSTIDIINSNIISTLGSGALVDNGASLNLRDSNLTALVHGIVASGGNVGAPNSILISGGSLSAVLGDAFQVQNGVTTIVVDNGATIMGNSSLLRVLDPGTVVDFRASHASLLGDIFADPASQTKVSLTNGTVLTGNVNPLHEPAVDMRIDGSSQWIMTGSSNLKSLNLSPGADVSFSAPFFSLHRTLTIGNLAGTAGIFGMNIDLGLQIGDRIDITGTSAGSHLLTFVDVGHGLDLRRNAALLLVETVDGVAGFSGSTEGAVFKYYVVHGNGSGSTPNPNDWYLVRADQIVRDQVVRTEFLPPGSVNTPVGLSTIDALNNSANAAIGTYAAGTPLFYADLDTLSQRLGELRLLDAEGRLSVDPDGKGILPSTPPAQPTSSTWVRGFGNGAVINDQVSRSFDQNTGGFQVGGDQRFAALNGDLYLGTFFSYIYASRDFLDGSNGSSNAFSIGGYGTWVNPQGWYADLVLKYSQLWNYFNAPSSNGSISTGDYTIPSFGGSLEIGKRFDVGRFFFEPEAQLAGVWEGGNSYTVSNGLGVGLSDQFSLRGRLGLRAGMHLSFSNGVILEPYLKVSAIHEFLTGDQIALDGIPFQPTISGTWLDVGAGLAARLNRSVYLYGEYDYLNGDKIREPWALNAGVRWEWGSPGRDELQLVQNEPSGNHSTGKEIETKEVQPIPVKTTEPWEIKVGGPGWLANSSGISGFHGFNQNISVDAGQLLRHVNFIYAFNGEVRRGRWGVFGGFLYYNGQAGTPEGSGLVSKVDLGVQEFGGQLFGTYRVIDGPHGWLDLLVGFRDTYIGQQVGLQANNLAIDAASTQLVDGIAQRLTTGASDLGTLIKANIIDKLAALDNRNPVLPVGPVAEGLKAKISAAVQQLVQSNEPGLAAAIRTKAQARVSQLKTRLATQIANTLTSQLNRSFSFYDNWVDPLIGLRGRLNLTKAFYLTAYTDVGGFGIGSDIAVEAYAALGCQVTRNIYSEVGYHYLYDDFRDEGANDFLYQFSTHGVQISTGLNF
jgi:outer membrane autotransporter protein